MNQTYPNNIQIHKELYEKYWCCEGINESKLTFCQLNKAARNLKYKKYYTGASKNVQICSDRNIIIEQFKKLDFLETQIQQRNIRIYM